MRVHVLVASAGRPEACGALARRLQNQTLAPARIVFSVAERKDAPSDPYLDELPVRPEIVLGPRGASAQRNTALDEALAGSDVVVFFDDDYVPSRSALEVVCRLLFAYPHVGGVTGRVLRDGIGTAGISLEEAARIVDGWDETHVDRLPEIAVARWGLDGLYGCNMAFRSSVIGETRFDERLPLYSWQEDIDFSARVAGEMVRCDAMVGVHCGLKRGRERRGDRLGYSQVANPFYLWRKGTMRGRFALRLASRNVAANHLRMFRPEPWIDRRGRVRGNWSALLDGVLGRMRPERILEKE